MTATDEKEKPAGAAGEDRIIWREELLDKLGAHGISQRSLTRYIATGKVPKPDVWLSRQRMAWKRSTLAAAGLDVL